MVHAYSSEVALVGSTLLLRSLWARAVLRLRADPSRGAQAALDSELASSLRAELAAAETALAAAQGAVHLPEMLGKFQVRIAYHSFVEVECAFRTRNSILSCFRSEPMEAPLRFHTRFDESDALLFTGPRYNWF